MFHVKLSVARIICLVKSTKAKNPFGVKSFPGRVPTAKTQAAKCPMAKVRRTKKQYTNSLFALIAFTVHSQNFLQSFQWSDICQQQASVGCDTLPSGSVGSPQVRHVHEVSFPRGIVFKLFRLYFFNLALNQLLKRIYSCCTSFCIPSFHITINVYCFSDFNFFDV